MPTRRPGFFALACLLLVIGLNDCRADNGTNAKEGTATTREKSASEAKRAASAARAKQSFTKIVGQNFPSWDQNQDGRLSADEIGRLIADPSISGLEAAAVAAIHRYLRSNGAPSAVTQADLLSKAQEQPVLPESEDSRDVVRHDQNDGKPRFVTYYASFASHLKKAPRELFTGDGLDAGRHQASAGGPVSTCA